MVIWIFQTGEPLFTDKKKYRPMRAMSLAKFFSEKGHYVNIISSNFFHQEKVFRKKNLKEIKFSKYININLINSCGYKKNISLARFFDHLILSFNLMIYLFKQKSKPDFAIVGYPPAEFAFIASWWLKLNKVRFAIDIKDLWPMNFKNYNNSLLKFLFIFYKSLLDKSILRSSFLITISEGFSKLLRKPFKNYKKIFVLPLISYNRNEKYQSKIQYKKQINNFIKKKDKVFVFIGSFTTSFDFNPLLKIADESFKKKWNIKFIFCGYNEGFFLLKKKYSNNNKTLFLESTNFTTNKYIASKSNATLAPYKNFFDFNNSIPNKIYDYLSFNKKIITSLKGETRRYLKCNNAGKFYNNFNELKEILLKSKFKKQNFSRIILQEKFKYKELLKIISQ